MNWTRERVTIAIVVLAVAGGLAAWYARTDTGPCVKYLPTEQAGEAPQTIAQPTATTPARGVDWPATLGIWLAAFFTLAIMSFLYRDNPLYKIAEHIFVGVSAAYWMVAAFWSTIVPNLLLELFPREMKLTLLPNTDLDRVLEQRANESAFRWLVDYSSAAGDGLRAHWWQLMDFLSLVPLVLGIMLLWRLAPRGQWIARWPLAFVVGTFAGLRLVGYLGADFLRQIDSIILPLVEPVYSADPASGLYRLDLLATLSSSFNNLVVVLGVLCGLIYFFFSLEHKGAAGAGARAGIWVLMIAFGGGFGYTVMGRITLLTARFKFLVSDWLNLVPP
jgi:hypothetical protein